MNFHNVRDSFQGQEVTSFRKEETSEKESVSNQGDLGFAAHLHDVCADDPESLHCSTCVKQGYLALPFVIDFAAPTFSAHEVNAE